MNQNKLENLTIEGDSPVQVIIILKVESRAEYVLFCLNTGKPLSKSKYLLITDSEQVP